MDIRKTNRHETFFKGFTVKGILISGIFLLLFIMSCGSREERRDSYFYRGNELFTQKELMKARLEFKNALKIDPNFAGAYYMLGECEIKLKNIPQAFAYLNKAVELNPELWDAHISVAQLLVLANQWDKAKERIVLVLENQQESFKALITLSLLLVHENKANDAEKILRHVIEKYPEKVDGYITLANILEKKSASREAEAILKQGLNRKRKSPSLLLALAGFYANEKDFSKAESVYSILNKYYPHKKEYLFHQVGFYLKTDQPEKAENIYKELIVHEPEKASYRLILARFYEKQKRPDKTIEVLKQAIEDLPKELNLQLFLGKVYLRNDMLENSLKIYQDICENHSMKPEAVTARVQIAKIYSLQDKLSLAVSQIEAVLRENPKDLEAHFLRGVIYLVHGKGLEAVNEFRFIVGEAPQNPRGYLNLARAHLINIEQFLAVDNLKKAIKMNPRFKEAIDLIVNLYLREKSYDDGIGFLREIAENDPENLLAISELGDFYLMKGDIKRAEEKFKQLQEQDAENFIGFVKMSLIHIKKKEYTVAERQLDRALSLQSGNIQILEKAVELKMFLNKPDEALEKCQEQIIIVPSKESEIRILMSRIYHEQRRFDEAKEQIRRVINLNPNAAIPYAALGNLYLIEGAIDKGIEEFQSALKKKPDTVHLQFIIANFYELKKDYAKAIQWHEKILQDHPDFILSRNNLAYIYAKRASSQKNLDRALDLLAGIPERFVDANVMDTLGLILYQKGEYGRAVMVFKKAESKGGSPVIKLHLALAYAKTNEVATALKSLESALIGGGRGLSQEDKETAQGLLKRLEG